VKNWNLESVAHAADLVRIAFSPARYRQQMMLYYGDYITHNTWRNRWDFVVENLGYAWDSLMCAVKNHDWRCAADPESGHTEHWCERCGYSFDVWM